MPGASLLYLVGQRLQAVSLWHFTTGQPVLKLLHPLPEIVGQA
ncbi:hypothetical protein ADICEAN_02595 [Cesiribacter andamanensis AMV16]|uniref:Uncharacterized protein n=1 Tax=Cesiribacter andamanensis AMV16 TaxID=1279009 RepID=M7N507_9BACT|nr:hypothetical protein ADICEAN_02595 [Cesiribacter andamanensis AMV16]